MPITEYREIRFDPEALRLALNGQLGAVSPPTLPPSAMVGAVTVASADPAQLRIEVLMPGAKPRQALVDSAELLSVLSRECASRRIPLPQAAEKSVVAVDGGVALVMVLPRSATATPILRR